MILSTLAKEKRVERVGIKDSCVADELSTGSGAELVALGVPMNGVGLQEECDTWLVLGVLISSRLFCLTT